ncbi:hypothetical protein [Cyanobium sp. Aljojuca 7D2]|uniref:hypothetical protein n=1 Tax=Cyanobium sp. Aljojuca 7D2 TaxID=2823698 RepID=UPI0020CD4EA4|nr:hypothetical protein [Cyanobium sp. Aljojuca 7D2]
MWPASAPTPAKVETLLGDPTNPLTASERVSLKHLLQRYVEKGLNTPPSETTLQRSAAGLPRLEVPFVREAGPLSNAALFDLLDA